LTPEVDDRPPHHPPPMVDDRPTQILMLIRVMIRVMIRVVVVVLQTRMRICLL
jgi:hypothetical protein